MLLATDSFAATRRHCAKRDNNDDETMRELAQSLVEQFCKGGSLVPTTAPRERCFKVQLLIHLTRQSTDSPHPLPRDAVMDRTTNTPEAIEGCHEPTGHLRCLRRHQ